MKQSLFGACVHKETGKKHINVNKECEDSVAKSFCSNNGVISIALSDGAGSYEHSLAGSSIAVEYASKTLSSEFDAIWNMEEEEAAIYIIEKVCLPMERAAKANGWTNESMCATLLCVAKHPDERFIALHVGDGVIVSYSPGEGCSIVSQYEHKLASNVATFVNVPGTPYNIIRKRESVASFFLSSDGAEPYLVPPGKVTEPVLLLQQAAFVLSERELEEYMSLLINSIQKETHEDDDFSFALLSDFRKTRIVFDDMTEPQLCQLMDIKSFPQNRKCQKMYAFIVRELHFHPQGLSTRRLTKMLYLHRESRLKKKLDIMFPGEYLEYTKRRVFIR
jgi:Serine/threonine protein phosphatase